MFRPLAIVLLLGRVLAGGVGQAPATPDSSSLLSVVPGDGRVSVAAIENVRALAHKGLARLAPSFPTTPTRPIAIVVHSDAQSLPTALREHLHNGTAGFALLGRDQVHVLLDEALREPPNDLRTVIVHELAHVLLDQYAGAAGPFVPRWLHEGLAQELSGGPYLGVQEENLLFAITARTMSRFGELEVAFPDRDDLLRLAYAQSFSFVAYLVDRLGVRTLVDAARECRQDRPFHRALLDATEITQAKLQEEWENHVLFHSGAPARYLLNNCFSFLIVLAVPLLVVAAAKRYRLNHRRKEQLGAEERARATDAGLRPEDA